MLPDRDQLQLQEEKAAVQELVKTPGATIADVAFLSLSLACCSDA